MEDDWKLPVRLVLPAELFRLCVDLCIDELWTPEARGVLIDGVKSGESPPLSVQDIRDASAMCRSIVKRPFWKRREIAATWRQDPAVYVLTEIAGLRAESKGASYVRVPRRSQKWLIGGSIAPARRPENCEMWFEELRFSGVYFAWIELGGDADIGRWLAIASACMHDEHGD